MERRTNPPQSHHYRVDSKTTSGSHIAPDSQVSYQFSPPAQSASYDTSWEDPTQATFSYSQATFSSPADYNFDWQAPVQPAFNQYSQSPVFPISPTSYLPSPNSPYFGYEANGYDPLPPFPSVQNSQGPSSLTSPASPTSNRADLIAKASKNPDRWQCLQCPSHFTRCADLNRHYSTMHGPREASIDCPKPGCPRVGKDGFSRKDHLREHLRQYHKEGGVGKRRG